MEQYSMGWEKDPQNWHMERSPTGKKASFPSDGSGVESINLWAHSILQKLEILFSSFSNLTVANKGET